MMDSLLSRRDFVQRLAAAGAAFAGAPAALAADGPAEPLSGPFVAKPYVQLGNYASLASRERMAISWQTLDVDADWTVEYRPIRGGAWRATPRPVHHAIRVKGIGPHRVYAASMTDLVPGGVYEYRVSMGGKVVFTSVAHARKPASADYRFVVFGDCGSGSPEQRRVAYQTYKAKPDFVMIPGDIVYNSGRISEYRKNFYPVYNADTADPATGVPLMRNTLFVTAPGNHDVQYNSLDQAPDRLAYFMYWDQPLNGPIGQIGAPNTPVPGGAESLKQAFYANAGEAYPRLANYSFDYGNAHWLVLDSDPYVNPNHDVIRNYVERDLANARGAAWRFVSFHHASFSSARTHFNDQYMRALHPLFEKYGVDVVFNGHVHNYQRNYPLRFEPEMGADGKPAIRKDGKLGGKLTLDKQFDGKKHTRMDGVLYLVTGAGGASLHDPEVQQNRDLWQPHTCKYIADIHSMTQVDVRGKRLSFQQIDAHGNTIDAFEVTK